MFIQKKIISVHDHIQALQARIHALETEGRRNTELLAASRTYTRTLERRFQDFASAVVNYMYIVRFNNGHFIETIHNRACEAISGYTLEEFQRDPDLWSKMIVDEDRDEVLRMLSDILEKRENASFEHRIRHKDGSIKWIRNNIIFIYDETGECNSYIGLVSDITEVKNARQVLDLMQAEMRLASSIQKAYLPDPSTLKKYGPLDIFYRYDPLHGVGGDVLSINLLPNNSIGVFVADVVGHGVPAALVTGVVKTTSEMVREHFPYAPAEYLDQLNIYMSRYLYAVGQFITALYAVFEPLENGTMRFTWAKGAHPYPLHYDAVSKSFELLQTSGPLVGVFPKPHYEQRSILLNKGDRIFLYTDGVTETRLEDGSLLQHDMNWDVIFANPSGRSIKTTVNTVLKRLDMLRNGQPTEDDIVLAGFEVR